MGMVSYQNQLIQAAINKKLWMKPLGMAGRWPIWYLRTKESYRNSNPRIMIASGFHGEEKAGPLALLNWIETFDPSLYTKVDLSFLPVANPIAFHKGQRYNDKKQKSNQGFCHPESGDPLSDEGVILLKNAQLLKSAARDGFLSLHEDVAAYLGDLSAGTYYVYSYEHTKAPTEFALAIRDELGKFFKTRLDDQDIRSDSTWTTEMKHNADSLKAIDGIIFKHCDGGFDDWLYHEGSRCIVAETPGNYPLAKRIEAHMAVINKFIELSRSK